MARFVVTTLCAAIFLASCSKSEPQTSELSASTDSSAPQNKFGFSEALVERPIFPDPATEVRRTSESASASAANAATASASEIQIAPVAAPRIAYAYTFGFRVSAANMPGLQQSHAQICEKMGPQACRVMSMSQSGEQDYAFGELKIEVAASKATSFGAQLEKAAVGSGGEQISSAKSGEDLSKQIVDTEAKLRARSLLRDRLMQLLATRQGTVAELIEAERGVAAVNQEIDEAQSWLKELNGRVEFSAVEVSYQSVSAGGAGFLSPIRTVLGSLGTILGGVIAALIAIAVSLVPIALFVAGVRWIWRKARIALGKIQSVERVAAQTASAADANA